jgi:hypothetical protein
MPQATKQAVFSPGLFSFLADLRANNNREWFAANKERYEQQLLEPALAFIDAFAPRLEKISPHFRADARPSGGSLFRIYRDTRFSKDNGHRGGGEHSRGDPRGPGTLAARHAGRRLREAARTRRRLAQARPALGGPGAPLRGRVGAENSDSDGRRSRTGFGERRLSGQPAHIASATRRQRLIPRIAVRA